MKTTRNYPGLDDQHVMMEPYLEPSIKKTSSNVEVPFRAFRQFSDVIELPFNSVDDDLLPTFDNTVPAVQPLPSSPLPVLEVEKYCLANNKNALLLNFMDSSEEPIVADFQSPKSPQTAYGQVISNDVTLYPLAKSFMEDSISTNLSSLSAKPSNYFEDITSYMPLDSIPLFPELLMLPEQFNNSVVKTSQQCESIPMTPVAQQLLVPPKETTIKNHMKAIKKPYNTRLRSHKKQCIQHANLEQGLLKRRRTNEQRPTMRTGATTAHDKWIHSKDWVHINLLQLKNPIKKTSPNYVQTRCYKSKPMQFTIYPFK